MDGRRSRDDGGLLFGRAGGSMGRGCDVVLLPLVCNERNRVARACII